MQTLPRSIASQDVSTQTCARPAFSFSLDAAVQTPLRSVLSHDTPTQLPLTEFFIGCVFSNDRLNCQCSSPVQCGTDSASPPQPSDTATICNPSDSSLVRDGHAHTTAPHVLLEPPLGLEEYAPPPGFEKSSHLCASHGKPVKAAPVRPRLFTAFSVTPPTAPLLVPSMWEHIMHVQPLQVREVPVLLLWWERTILSVQILVQGLVLFLSRVPSFSLWFTLVNPNRKGTVVLIQLTVISCIINSVFPYFNGIQARRAEIPPILSRRPVESSMRLFFRSQ